MLVQEYLRTKSLEDLTAELGIQVRRHGKYPNLVGLCYWNITSPWYHPIVSECRGLILDETDNWNVVAYPFNRFYNYGEPGSANIDFENSVAYKKLDGSLIILFSYNNEWLVATTGSPDASGTINDWNITFGELTWTVFNQEYYDILCKLDSNYTYMFELCTPFNKVVVPHTNNSLTLIGVRNNITLLEESIHQSKFNNFKLVECITNKLTINELQLELFKLDGLYNEGFVICDNNFNRVKLKHDNYVKYHHIKFNTTKRDILELIRTGEGNEFINQFPEFYIIYNNYLTKYIKLCQLINYDLIRFKDINDQKQFALTISNIRWKSILFSIRSGHSKSVGEALSKLLIQHFEELLESC